MVMMILRSMIWTKNANDSVLAVIEFKKYPIKKMNERNLISLINYSQSTNVPG